MEIFQKGSDYQATAQKAELLKTALRLTKACRGTIAKKFIRMEILLFRNGIFLETESASLQFLKLRQGIRNYLMHRKKGSAN
jgi:hypothetical protein